ncbi:biotin-dependent carboxyltransferase family protein [Herbiconiux sp. CPCC 205716]|uniref:Biotin-dependent carboxyltransferase family protein n=1 Tax=Herbiconiux gentiana TaxID=2970912 RepID=A0ABT2GA34_9MICO|nr:biotin-dependent carboxyltransferase family protein [Herbiconiux gentiana]MCS5713053.1 biotin-dependent carboxyltransferase family protein [Herbiconiux gentiana]
MPAEHAVEVRATGPLTLLQDAGRPGFAHLGVTGSGAADQGAYRAANRLVGNTPGEAVLESVLGGVALRARGALLVAVTGASASVVVERGDGRAAVEHPMGCSFTLGDGDVVTVGMPTAGLRTMLAVRGGFAVPTTLGSRSSDVLSGLGPAPVRVGDVLTVGEHPGDWPEATLLPAVVGRQVASGRRGDERMLAVMPGPRADLAGAAGWPRLLASAWTVSPSSNRVGVRLLSAPGSAAPLDTAPASTLPSEGMVVGAVQLPPNGEPVVFLRDHPVTGGYPVIAVLTAAAVDLAAQLRPGDVVLFAAVRG